MSIYRVFTLLSNQAGSQLLSMAITTTCSIPHISGSAYSSWYHWRSFQGYSAKRTNSSLTHPTSTACVICTRSNQITTSAGTVRQVASHTSSVLSAPAAVSSASRSCSINQPWAVGSTLPPAYGPVAQATTSQWRSLVLRCAGCKVTSRGRRNHQYTNVGDPSYNLSVGQYDGRRYLRRYQKKWRSQIPTYQNTYDSHDFSLLDASSIHSVCCSNILYPTLCPYLHRPMFFVMLIYPLIRSPLFVSIGCSSGSHLR